MERLKIVEPALEFEAEFIAMAKDFIAISEQAEPPYNCEKAIEDFGGYVQCRIDWKNGENLPEGFVKCSLFLLIRNDGKLVGMSSMRHELSDFLRNIGGHIGYHIRPGYRRKGYGTAILGLVLEEAHKIGLEKVLVTCSPSNIGSAKIIERNGGKFENTYTNDELDEPKRRYWFDMEKINGK